MPGINYRLFYERNSESCRALRQQVAEHTA